MLSPKVGFAALAILGLPVLIAAAVFGPAAFDLAFHRRPPERYVIPAGFTGWTRIDFRKPGAPRLPIEDGHLLLRLDALGRLATSSDPQLGHGKDQFFAASSTGLQPLPYVGVCKGGVIWGLETLVDEHTDTPYTRFFVGTEDQYRRQVDPTGRNFPSSC